ncbi:MAG: hypothetical protein A3D65_02050 [Candidatus Lloydbacteria bacterium RIFCSPHIGHO2_02_FULL_50_13]|uniref:Uncharacterized protein n=1 Tax=Candidatus Lloydbacteria bacterium RIFCSPHIGHO2_02_FULL_50_13 TaxID=1798661 RepID=A0A1G2CZN3_9BACT|nr:MAG: hypothetical protein A3D65_02050 [Candidatus Lloydbacteria bacterium RIFCSPHIGHO2_02_FULL_50_13]
MNINWKSDIGLDASAVTYLFLVPLFVISVVVSSFGGLLALAGILATLHLSSHNELMSELMWIGSLVFLAGGLAFFVAMELWPTSRDDWLERVRRGEMWEDSVAASCAPQRSIYHELSRSNFRGPFL